MNFDVARRESFRVHLFKLQTVRLLLFLSAVACFITMRIWHEQPDDLLHIVFCDVGQGDAILIFHKTTQLLIDAGPDDSVVSCLNTYMPFWDRTIEFVIATHADADHIVGMKAVLDRFNANLIYVPLVAKETSDFKAFEKAVQIEADNGANVAVGNRGQTLQVGPGIIGQLIWPSVVQNSQKRNIFDPSETTLSDIFANQIPNGENHNDLSISLFLTFDQVSIALVGDLEKGGETAVIGSGLIQDVDILKVGHHGSKTSSGSEFLANLRPEIAVINSGKDNSFGHPTPEVMSRLNDFGALIFRTDTSGTIEIVTDGNSIFVPSDLTEQ